MLKIKSESSIVISLSKLNINQYNLVISVILVKYYYRTCGLTFLSPQSPLLIGDLKNFPCA